MNTAAEKHLSRAEGYIEKGDGWYRKAAEEIVAAMDADPNLTQREIGERFDRSRHWVGEMVRFATTGEPDLLSPDWKRGSHATTAEIQEGAAKVLAKAPLETIEHIVEAMTPKQAAKLAHAALAREGVARELAQSPESGAAVTRASIVVHEERVERNKQRRRKDKGAFGNLTASAEFIANVLGNLTVAKNRLRDSYNAAREHAPITGENLEVIEEELNDIVSIIDWYRSFLDSGDRSFEDELDKLLDPNN